MMLCFRLVPVFIFPFLMPMADHLSQLETGEQSAGEIKTG